jgi:hypothetical protein
MVVGITIAKYELLVSTFCFVLSNVTNIFDLVILYEFYLLPLQFRMKWYGVLEVICRSRIGVCVVKLPIVQ